MYKPELLSPAGSPESLTAAVRAGADAVYLGVGMFNARRNARNFTIDPTDDAACSLAERKRESISIFTANPRIREISVS